MIRIIAKILNKSYSNSAKVNQSKTSLQIKCKQCGWFPTPEDIKSCNLETITHGGWQNSRNGHRICPRCKTKNSD